MRIAEIIKQGKVVVLMAYSTEKYYLKPILSKFPSLSRVDKELNKSFFYNKHFSQGFYYYYAYDDIFRDRCFKWVRFLRAFKREINSRDVTDCLEMFNCLEKLMRTSEFSPVNVEWQSYREGWLSQHATIHWAKKTYELRKKAIKKYYTRKEYPEVYSLFTQCNKLLVKLAIKSIKETRDIDFYLKTFLPLEWLMQSLTESDLHTDKDFRKLFQANIRIKNDLIQILGIFNILIHSNGAEFFYSQKAAIDYEAYYTFFEQLLDSGQEIINLYSSTVVPTRKKEWRRKKSILLAESNTMQDPNRLADSSEKAALQEDWQTIISMHKIAVERKVQDMRINEEYDKREERNHESFNDRF